MSKTLLEQKLDGWNEEVERNTVDVYIDEIDRDNARVFFIYNALPI